MFSERGYTAVLRKRGRGSCVWTDSDGAFGGRKSGREQRIVFVCLELKKLRERPPYHLSGGEKRKVSLACILSLNPEVLILDEPLAGLDEKTQDMLLDFLKKLS